LVTQFHLQKIQHKSMKYYLGFAILVISMLSSCKKDAPVDPIDPCISTEDVDVSLRLRMVFGESDLAFNTDYTLANGMHVTFREAQVYLGSISLVQSGATVIPINDVALFSPDKKEALLGKFKQEEISEIGFSLGIDSARNHADPTAYPVGHALNFHVPSMHWSWNQGYIFALMEGRYSDSTITAANPGENWYFHIGLDGNYKLKSPLTVSLKPSTCGVNKIPLKLDFKEILGNIDLPTENATLSTDNFGLSFRVGNHLINAITIDEP